MSEEIQSVISYNEFYDVCKNFDVKSDNFSMSELSKGSKRNFDEFFSSENDSTISPNQICQLINRAAPNIIKGPWSPKEDLKLLKWVQKEGPCKWTQCANTIDGRTGKQCRERWYNSLCSISKKRDWTAEEDFLIFVLYSYFGTKWSLISQYIPGRKENSVKNRFYSTLRKMHLEILKDETNKPDFFESISHYINEGKKNVGLNQLIRYYPQTLERVTNNFQKEKNLTEEQISNYKDKLETELGLIKNNSKENNFELNSSLSTASGHTISISGENCNYTFKFTVNKVCNGIATVHRSKKGNKKKENSSKEKTITDANSSTKNSKKNDEDKSVFVNFSFNIGNETIEKPNNNYILLSKYDINRIINEFSHLESVVKAAKDELIALKLENDKK